MLSNTLQNNIFNRLVVGFKANFLLVGPGPIGGMHCVGGLSKGSYPVFSRVSLKATENSEFPESNFIRLLTLLQHTLQMRNIGYRYQLF